MHIEELLWKNRIFVMPLLSPKVILTAYASLSVIKNKESKLLVESSHSPYLKSVLLFFHEKHSKQVAIFLYNSNV